jgi:lysophospholipase L1-like esterase
MGVGGDVLGARLLSEVLMNPFVRYLVLAAGAFLATLAFVWIARVASIGYGTLGGAVTHSLSPSPVPKAAKTAKAPSKPAPAPVAAAPVEAPTPAPAQSPPPTPPPTSAPPAAPPAAPRSADDVHPILPARLAAVAGQPFELYYDGLILARDPDAYKIEIVAPTLKGTSERRRWRVTPEAGDAGSHTVTVVVRDWNDKVLAEASATLDVVPPGKPPASFNLLIAGASDIHQGLVPNALWTKLNTWSGGQVKFIGTHHPKPTLPIYRELLPDVVHEGYGGWGWQLFVNHYMPGKEELYKRAASPFVFLEDGKPTLDVGRYLDERGVRGHLDAVVFYLGINETFAANPDVSKDTELAISTALGWADQLIAAFKAAAPETKIFLAIPPPFTRSEPTFMARYASIKPEFGDPWRHRRIVQTLARRMIEHFDGKSPDVTVVPLPALFDVTDGYWQIDPGHPNEVGAEQVARALYAAIVRKFYSL